MSASAYPPAYGTPDDAHPSRRERREARRRERRWREETEGHRPSRWSPWTAPKPIMIAIMIVAFIVFFPIGLMILGFMIGAGRIGRSWARRWGAEANGPDGARGWCGWAGDRDGGSGNLAFDEYRVDTLRRLEEEQKDFAAFLERLRFAKDRAEFEQFMTDRRSRPAAPPPAEGERPAQG
jgi:hypothetical protein